MQKNGAKQYWYTSPEWYHGPKWYTKGAKQAPECPKKIEIAKAYAFRNAKKLGTIAKYV